MKKKNYVQPEFQIILVEKADIIATSTRANGTEEYDYIDTPSWYIP